MEWPLFEEAVSIRGESRVGTGRKVARLISPRYIGTRPRGIRRIEDAYEIESFNYAELRRRVVAE